MKKFKILFAVILFTAFMGSCTMTEWDDIFGLNITPTLIMKTPKLYPGGNAECSNIGISGLLKTTGRNNYIASTDGFESGWPSGLIVKVTEDRSVAFQIDGTINLGDGKCYKIGAVIVKGGDASNVYDYTEIGGAAMDKGLVSPNNSNGMPAGLSNLTFCFIECEKEPLYIAIKLAYWVPPTYVPDSWNSIWAWGLSSGDLHYTYSGSDWCRPANLGIIEYPTKSNGEIHAYATNEIIGSINIIPEGSNTIKITVQLKDNAIMDKIYLYAGNKSGLGLNTPITVCPNYYTTWPYQDDTDSNIYSFTVPF